MQYERNVAAQLEAAAVLREYKNDAYDVSRKMFEGKWLRQEKGGGGGYDWDRKLDFLRLQ